MIFIPLSQFVAVWLIRKVHSVVLQSGNCTEHPYELSEDRCNNNYYLFPYMYVKNTDGSLDRSSVCKHTSPSPS